MSENSLSKQSIRVNKHQSKITIFLLTEMLIILCKKICTNDNFSWDKMICIRI